MQSKKEIYGGDYETEWEFLKNVLLKNGVPEEAILMENQATFTYENANFFQAGDRPSQNSCEKSDSVLQNLPCQKITDVLSAFISGDGNYGMSGLPRMELPGTNRRETETGVEAVTGEIDRIVKQFCLSWEIGEIRKIRMIRFGNIRIFTIEIYRKYRHLQACRL